MIGLDTNVLVRYFTQDDAKQAALADRCIQERCTAEQPCRIDLVVLCELVWVLETAYGYSRQPIADVMEMMLHTRQFFIPERPLVRAALVSYRTGPADFADELIGQGNRLAECETTYTFDRKAARLPTFTVLR